MRKPRSGCARAREFIGILVWLLFSSIGCQQCRAITRPARLPTLSFRSFTRFALSALEWEIGRTKPVQRTFSPKVGDEVAHYWRKMIYGMASRPGTPTAQDRSFRYT